ncbi:glycine/sarcosine/betaine reductase complex component C subunit beta [Miniphocaeibacter halophilus]|uniref:Ketoacyl-ACP synthase III family protein n=1 Tax=Miniphocaeibacter halophilus TaxID=2931922 RepID=A0AC61ND65_9FIRM|nr:glycine/sarcosine/betaine reductase complex component C subunit beta [Miniphocaeibacter halophilus]QQK08693.1 ketoacyl-ACP synthase III family protein [Miniphocaeibacter halophilus]
MSFPVIKNAGYVLVHTPDMIIQNGSTTSTERVVNPDSDFLKEVGKHIRTYEEVVNYLPNQVYIGNLRPEELNNYELPWHDKEFKGQRKGKFGEITPQDEFIAVMKICDSFELVELTEEFINEIKPKIEENYPELIDAFNKIKPYDVEADKHLLDEEKAEGLYNDGKLVGIVKAAHDVDVNLNAHTMFENLVVKASGVLATIALLRNTSVNKDEIDYVVECSEEACGDINQRGGGNFAKAIAEVAQLTNASGSDTRGFCAAPIHSLIEAAALVKAGVYKNVLVVAGGSTAKLGMNAKDHVKKGHPVLEDVLGTFAILVSENDGVSPIFRTDLTGKHNVGTGSSPQAVMTSLITTGLDRANLKITDVDTYSVEMQNPDITVPAGAGNVPEANYKMIAALAVKRGDIERAQLKSLIEEKGLPGWAPTQGHIPSGVPYIGYMIDDLTSGDKNRVMFVGKGSLFLGRMTNLFDGVSFICERNTGEESDDQGISKEEIKKIIGESLRELASNMLQE